MFLIMIKINDNILEEKGNYLSEAQRPDSVNKAIDEAFSKISQNKTSNWRLHNGSHSYGLLNIDEISLITKIILNAPEQKDFYFLDVGAANFELCQAIGDYFQKKPCLEGKCLHLFGVRGESGKDIEKTQGHCKLYFLTCFKAENIYKEFIERKFDLKNKFDFVTSNWCLRHFADPVGSLLQIYRLMRPNTGLFSTSGFYLDVNNNKAPEAGNAVHMLLFFLCFSKIPFLVRNTQSDKSGGYYLLQKLSLDDIELSWQYEGIRSISPDWDIGANVVTLFKTSKMDKSESEKLFNYSVNMIKAENKSSQQEDCVAGNQTLYNWLSTNGLTKYKLIPVEFPVEGAEKASNSFLIPIKNNNNLNNEFLPSASIEICDEIALVFPKVIAEGTIPLEKQEQDRVKIVDVEWIKPIIQVNNISEVGSNYLSEAQRPDSVNKAIDEAFSKISQNKTSNWRLHNGSHSYGLLNIDEISLITKIILNAPEQKDFYFLDVGAANFELCQAIGDYFQKKPCLEGKCLHLFGVRGESGKDIEKTQGHCKLYFLTRFKAENIYKEFIERKFDLKNKFDFVTSNRCLRHFADPVGSLLQIYRLMRPNTGLFSTSGFFLDVDKNGAPEAGNAVDMLLFFLCYSKIPFLVRNTQSDKSGGHYLLQKLSLDDIELSWQYEGIRSVSSGWDIGANVVTLFKTSKMDKSESEKLFNYSVNMIKAENKSSQQEDCVAGNQTLYNWLSTNGLTKYKLIPVKFPAIGIN